MEPKRQMVEYKFLRQSTHHSIPRMRFSIAVYLTIFQIAFIILYGFFIGYKYDTPNSDGRNTFKRYSTLMDVHTLIFLGFPFMMAFLKRYGYGSMGFNFLVGAYVIEWALLVRGWIEQGIDPNTGMFTIGFENLLLADFCAAAVMVSFGAVIGKVSLSQLVVMATVEVVVQTVNEFIGRYFLRTSDVGESMYVFVFGAYFGLAVSKILHHKEIESTKENSHYHSDLFAMIGTFILWIYWPSFNSANALDEGQVRAVINTYLSLTASCVTTFIISILVGRGRINMKHVQNATLAGGVAIGTIADMPIQPFGALLIGSLAGIVSTLGFEYVQPLMKRAYMHDTCGVNNLFGFPGIIAGITGGIVASFASRENFQGDRLYRYFPARVPMINSTDFFLYNLTTTDFRTGGLGRTAGVQGGYQIAALAVTIGMALVSGVLTGYLMKIPIIERVDEEEEMFDDEPHFITPEDYSLKLAEVRVRSRDEQELEEKKTDLNV